MSRDLRIATFNLESLDDRPGHRPALAERIDVLRPQLLRLDADILCLQEVNGQKPERQGPRRLDALDALLAETPYAGFERLCSHRRDGTDILDRHNLVILSRLPMAEGGQIWHDRAPPPAAHQMTARPPMSAPAPVLWDRPMVWARVTLADGRALTVINVHLRAPLAAFIEGQKSTSHVWKSVSGWAEGFYLAAMKRAGQAFETRLFVDGLFDADGEALIAVCGDFNATERETPVRALIGAVEDTGNPGLSGRVLAPLEEGIAAAERYSVLHGGYRAMLDHMLVSPALRLACRGAEVHNEDLGDELRAFESASVSPESFHAPVVARFDL